MFLRAQLFRLTKQVDKLQPRERILVLVAALMLIGAIGQGLLTLAGLADPAPYQEKIQTARSQIEMNNLAIASIIERQNSSKIQQLKADQLQLQLQLNQLKTQVSETANFLIPPEEMTSILKNLLKKHRELKLIDFHTMPPVYIESVNSQLPLFNHGLKIKVEGGFNALTGWLQDMEKLPWVLNWDHLDYHIKTWPTGSMTIEIHTLSREESWLDV